jgi:hypothetical protein
MLRRGSMRTETFPRLLATDFGPLNTLSTLTKATLPGPSAQLTFSAVKKSIYSTLASQLREVSQEPTISFGIGFEVRGIRKQGLTSKGGWQILEK